MSFLLGTKSPVHGSTAPPAAPALDSNLRFLGGTGIGLGLILVWVVPAIEERTAWFRAAWLCAFLGGVGRLVSLFVTGASADVTLVQA